MSGQFKSQLIPQDRSVIYLDHASNAKLVLEVIDTGNK